MSIEQMKADFGANPSADAICRLADALKNAPDKEVARQVAARTSELFPDNAEVLSAVGAMYVSLGKLVEAQSFYVQASRADPKRPEQFVRLGEILLCRGDAQRSQKALERALQLGDASEEAMRLHQQAVGYVALQARDGNEAVAKAVSKGLKRPPASRPGRAPASTPQADVPRASPGPAAPTGSALSVEGVLIAAKQAGLFAGAQQALNWEAPIANDRRSWRAFAFGLITLLLAGVGAFVYGSSVRVHRAGLATELNDVLTHSLLFAEPRKQVAANHRLRESFRLDPTRTQTLEIWLKSLVLESLLGEKPRDLHAALVRAREVGLTPTLVAAAGAAALLDEGDVLGAMQTLLQHDSLATHDPYFQLVAASAFEQAGIEQAGDRYARATQLAPAMLSAQLLTAHYAILERRPLLVKRSVDALIQLAPNLPATTLLVRMAKEDDRTSRQKPMRVNDAAWRELPAVLVPLALLEQARMHAAEGNRNGTEEALERGVALARTPGAWVKLGQVALAIRAPAVLAEIVRRLEPSVPLHPGARTFSVRASLNAGDFKTVNESLKELGGDASLRLLIAVARAYEGLDAASLQILLRQAEGEETQTSELSALVAGAEIMIGRGYPTREQLEALESSPWPWARLVALDAALDTDHLDLAEKWLNNSAKPELLPVFLMRRARLLRYQGRTEEALRDVEQAAAAGVTGPRLQLEHVYVLVQAGNFNAARALLTPARDTDLPLVGTWLEAFIDAGSEYRMRARKAIVKLRPFADGTPVVFQALSARTLVVAEDPRAKRFAKEFVERAARYPDVMSILTAR